MEKIRFKKGQMGFEEIVYALAVLFGFALFVIILYYTWTQMAPEIETAVNSVLPAGASFNVTNMNNNISSGTTMFNAIFPFLILGLLAFVIISAFFINSHPTFFFITFIILAVVILLGVIFSNVYQQLTYDTDLSSVKGQFNIIEIFMKNLPLIAIVFTCALVVVLFGLSNKGGSTGGL